MDPYPYPVYKSLDPVQAVRFHRLSTHSNVRTASEINMVFRRLAVVFLSLLFVIILDFSTSEVTGTATEDETRDTPVTDDVPIYDETNGGGWDGFDGASSSKKDVITDSTWIVSASTPTKPMIAHPFKRDSVNRLPPFVHWVCFRQSPAQSSKDKLFCCQSIYQRMEEEPESLCWIRGGCMNQQQGRDERSTFLRHCTEQIEIVPLLEQPIRSFQPQFSLILAPAIDYLQTEPSWRQFLWYSTSGTGHWHYRLTSPLELVVDLKTDEKPDDRPNIAANLSTSVLGGKDDRDRVLQHKLQIDLKAPSLTESKVNSWSAKVSIALFVPEDLMLASKNTLGPCKTSCGAKCTVAFLSTIETKSTTERQELFVMTLHVEGKKKKDNCHVEWTTCLKLEDEDEDLLLSAPGILQGELIAVAKSGSTKYRLASGLECPFPLSTKVNGDDEL